MPLNPDSPDTLVICRTGSGMSLQADRRADLDVQISLLAEHDITRLISLVSAMADQMGLSKGKNSDLAEQEKDVLPEQVLDKIEEAQQQFEKEE